MNSSIPTENNLSFLHLQVELARIDVLILHAVRRWQATRQGDGAADVLWGQYISDAEIDALLAQPLGAGWGGANLRGTADLAKLVEEIRGRAQALQQAAQEQGQTLALKRLVEVFGLEQFELDALLICLAPALDRRYERFYGYLQDDATRGWPSVNLILELLCEPGPERLWQLNYFAADAPLLRYRLLTPVAEPGIVEPSLLNQTLRPNKTIVAWLLGRYQPHAKLKNHVTLETPRVSEADKLLAEKYMQNIHQDDAVQPTLFAFYGDDELSQRAAARLLAARAQAPLLMVDLPAALRIIQKTITGIGAVTSEAAAVEVIDLALRDARLFGAVPYFADWDVCIEDGAPPPELLACLYAYAGAVIVAGRQKWQIRNTGFQHPVIWLDFPRPSPAQRRAIWTHFLNGPEEVGELDIGSLAGQFILSSSQIRDAVATAKNMAAQRGGEIHDDDLYAAARDHSNPRLAALARKIVPRYNWSDLILPNDQLIILRELVATVRGRPIVLDEWGLGAKLVSGAGITVLFAGPPGTGKTMAAEVLARDLGFDLYKIDLSTVVSKYIGETEKNLSRVFDEAESSNAILFFDEADALFGKRSAVRDAHDRYANIEISYLLQRMETYDGVAILATNLRANLDEAFTRRLRFVVEFPFPGEADRLRIWQALFPTSVPHQAELDLALMARRFKLSGGGIRNVIVHAAHLAAADGREVSMNHLLHATRRELQKAGRLVSEADLRIGN